MALKAGTNPVACRAFVPTPMRPAGYYFQGSYQGQSFPTKTGISGVIAQLVFVTTSGAE
ncbi:MAG: hypothetical protein ACJ8C4_06615 [Gemmataceae bacterium]